MQRARLRRVPPGALSPPLSLSSLLPVRTRFHPWWNSRFSFRGTSPPPSPPSPPPRGPFGAPPFSPRATFIARRDKPARSDCRLRLILQLSLIQRIPRGTLLLLPSIWNRWNLSSSPLPSSRFRLSSTAATRGASCARESVRESRCVSRRCGETPCV